MRILALLAITAMLYFPAPPVEAAEPFYYHLPFENFDSAREDWIEQTGLKTIEDRKWETVNGKFGKALYIGAVPLKYDNDNMSGLDLDMVTAVIFNVAYSSSKGRGYDEPFIWGAGKLHPGSGAVAFWTKGSSKPESEDARTILFEQTTTSWGRLERQLIEIELYRDGTVSAYAEDARYVQHTVKTKKVWKDNDWNHVVFMWNRGSGVSLWVNGREEASTMGSDAWWENQRPGLFHLPMAKAVYDEFYIFPRTLTKQEVTDLFKSNKAPASAFAVTEAVLNNRSMLRDAFTTDVSRLPVASPSSGEALVYHNLTPERIHDEGIQGWWIADGRYELAWPHEYSIFTIIPGDVDFHAEKADILPPKAATVNYMTFEGNLDGVTVLKGDREGGFDSTPALTVPETSGFFYGTTVQGLGDSELRIPFTKSYGAPPGFESDGDVLRLPLSGDLRLHEVGIFNVYTDFLTLVPGHRTLHLNPRPVDLDDTRYLTALSALYSSNDRTAAGLYNSREDTRPRTIDMSAMSKLQLLSEQAVGSYAFDTVIVDLWVRAQSDDTVLQFKLLDPAVPSHTWAHAETRLNGFTGDYKRLRVALRFDPAFLVSGDRLWLEIMSTETLSIIACDTERPSTVTLLPHIDRRIAEQKFSDKTMKPAILVFGRSFEYIPWEFDKRLPDVDAPVNFGGMFDMAYPWQAVLKVNPGDKTANIYKAFTTGDYTRGRYPSDMNKLFGYDVQSRQFDRYPGDGGITVFGRTFHAPESAPAWAVYFRELQTFRNRIVTWWRHHQRSDGQAGGGWNDDTLIFSRAFGDMPLDSNPDALALYNNVFDGFDRTNYFKGGYCRIHPIDRLHNGDFVRERYKSLVYNIGDPRSAVWAMEEAWHWGKPDQTPVNYGDGRAFLFGKDVMEWYWGRQSADTPYELNDTKQLTETLLRAAVVNNDTTLWRFTEAWCHTDDQSQYGADQMPDMLLGGWGSAPRKGTPEFNESNVNITVGVGWIEGGGPQLGRLVRYSGKDKLTVDMYSFDSFERTVSARLYRIADGSYRVTLRSDTDNDGTYETGIIEEDRELRRFGTLDLTLPSQVPCRLEVTQTKAAPPSGDLPDLAISPYYLTAEGTTVKCTIFNIGSAPSGPFAVKVRCPNGGDLKTVRVESIPGSDDFVPKKTDLTITGLPPRSGYRIVIDEDNAIREIFDGNNSAMALTGSF